MEYPAQVLGPIRNGVFRNAFLVNGDSATAFSSRPKLRNFEVHSFILGNDLLLSDYSALA